MQLALLTVALALATAGAGPTPLAVVAETSELLATVQITNPVLVGGQSLAAGTYDLRLAEGGPAPLPGQSVDAQRWVEFVVGNVVGCDVAEILCDTDITPVGASATPIRDGTQVVVLKGGEFVRISVKRAGERYLIHLPVVP